MSETIKSSERLCDATDIVQSEVASDAFSFDWPEGSAKCADWAARCVIVANWEYNCFGSGGPS